MQGLELRVQGLCLVGFQVCYRVMGAARVLGWVNVGALIIRTGFWGIVYYNYNKEAPE